MSSPSKTGHGPIDRVPSRKTCWRKQKQRCLRRIVDLQSWRCEKRLRQRRRPAFWKRCRANGRRARLMKSVNHRVSRSDGFLKTTKFVELIYTGIAN